MMDGEGLVSGRRCHSGCLRDGTASLQGGKRVGGVHGVSHTPWGSIKYINHDNINQNTGEKRCKILNGRGFEPLRVSPVENYHW